MIIFGDIMLDKYTSGEIERISPEAPIPILKHFDTTYKLGGAANVAINLKKLGQDPLLFGIIGDDQNGEKIQELLNKEKIRSNIKISNKMPTIVKNRFLANNQQLLRYDIEETPNTEVIKSLMKDFIQNMTSDLILISDYDKGSISNLFNEIEDKYKKNFIVDTKRSNLGIFRHSKVYKPNYMEFCKIFEKKISVEEIDKHAKILIDKFSFESVVVTLADKGAIVVSENKSTFLEAKKVEVADVTGAGDVFIASIAHFLSEGLSILDSSQKGIEYASESVKYQGNHFDP